MQKLVFVASAMLLAYMDMARAPLTTRRNSPPRSRVSETTCIAGVVSH